jgi:Ca-activated chloride channel family protein
MKYLFILIPLILLQFAVSGQNERKYVRQGNRYYMNGLRDTTKIDSVAFSKAETEYRKALDKKPDDLKWNFNLNNSLYKQKKLNDAATGYEQIARQLIDPKEKSGALHNLGNARLFQQQIDEAIDTYKKALRINPGDMETKYNLAYAQQLKKQQQQKNQDKNKDKDKDKDKDQQKQNKDQNKDQNKQQQQPPPKISKQNAEQLLQALQNDEKNIQDKVKKAQAVQVKSSRVEKDW